MSDVKVTQVPAEDRELPVFAEIEQLMEAIRGRAYALSAGRGFAGGRELDDWLAAEREFCWPASQLKESDERFEIEIALAGFEPAEVAVTATPRELIVKAARETPPEEGPAPRPEETRWSTFRSEAVYRRIELPQAIEVGKVTARLRNGLLVVVLPKAKAPAAKIVAVKEAA